MVGYKHTHNLQQNDYVDTEYDRWVISEIDNHQIITVILELEYHKNRPTLEEEAEEEENN